MNASWTAKFNTEFAKQVLAYAETKRPGFKFNMAKWFGRWKNQTGCGTSACLAGIVGILSPDVEIRPYTAPFSTGWLAFVDGYEINWIELAEQRLGLPYGMTYWLCNTFNERRALDMLREYIAEAEAAQTKTGRVAVPDDRED